MNLFIAVLIYFMGMYLAWVGIITINDNVRMKTEYSYVIKNRYCLFSWLFLILAGVAYVFKKVEYKGKQNAEKILENKI